jgi:hypothetical protein
MMRMACDAKEKEVSFTLVKVLYFLKRFSFIEISFLSSTKFYIRTFTASLIFPKQVLYFAGSILVPFGTPWHKTPCIIKWCFRNVHVPCTQVCAHYTNFKV